MKKVCRICAESITVDVPEGEGDFVSCQDCRSFYHAECLKIDVKQKYTCKNCDVGKSDKKERKRRGRRKKPKKPPKKKKNEMKEAEYEVEEIYCHGDFYILSEEEQKEKREMSPEEAKKKYKDHKIRLFLVKWVGYPVLESTWEPHYNLDDCTIYESYVEANGKNFFRFDETLNGYTLSSLDELRLGKFPPLPKFWTVNGLQPKVVFGDMVVEKRLKVREAEEKSKKRKRKSRDGKKNRKRRKKMPESEEEEDEVENQVVEESVVEPDPEPEKLITDDDIFNFGNEDEDIFDFPPLPRIGFEDNGIGDLENGFFDNVFDDPHSEINFTQFLS